jgi:predicted helicase
MYHEALVERSRSDIMQHMMIGVNLALVSARSNKSPSMDHFFCSRDIMETKCGERTTQSALFPLYLYPNGDELIQASPWPAGKDGRRPNLSAPFVTDLSSRLRLKFVSDGVGDRKITFGPEDILHYIYAIFHSPTYRTRYAELLRIDFPRVPLTSDRKLFARLCELGAELVGLHLLENTPTPRATYPIPGDNRVEKPHYKPLTAEAPGRVYVNGTQYFADVPHDVWEFHVGGYRVCEKWLKDRKGRTLTYDDIETYRKITEAIRQTIRLMSAIDAFIPAWPLP